MQPKDELGQFLWEVFREILIADLGKFSGRLRGEFKGTWRNLGGKGPGKHYFTLSETQFTLKNWFYSNNQITFHQKFVKSIIYFWFFIEKGPIIIYLTVLCDLSESRLARQRVLLKWSLGKS